MPKTKEQKQEIIEKIKKNFSLQKSVVLIGFKGSNSISFFGLRNKLKESNCLLMVIKKTLLKKTLETLEQKNLAEKITEIKGELALAFGFEDEIMPAKISYESSKENKNLKILGGVFDGKLLEKDKVIELAQLPSREELLVRLKTTLQSPIFGFTGALKANIKKLLYIFSQITLNKQKVNQ